MFMKSKLALTIIIFLLTIGVLVPEHQAFAVANFSVSPLIIDYTTEKRDIINRDLVLTNNSDLPVRLYASVHEISTEAGSEVHKFITPSMTNRDTTITSWLQITRARLSIPARGTLTVPLTIRISPNTPPGTYHGLIGFADGPNRDNIEAKVISGQAATVILQITIADTKREALHLVSFTTDRFVIKPSDNSLSFTLQNNGDKPVTPGGEVIIYDTAGRELTSISVNSKRVEILPGEQTEITEPLPMIDKIGRNKAYLSLTYGQNQATIFDTAYYFSIPWYYLVLIFAFLLLILVILAWVFRRAFANQNKSYDTDLYDLPMFVKKSKEHTEFDHDINLKK